MRGLANLVYHGRNPMDVTLNESLQYELNSGVITSNNLVLSSPIRSAFAIQRAKLGVRLQIAGMKNPPTFRGITTNDGLTVDHTPLGKFGFVVGDPLEFHHDASFSMTKHISVLNTVYNRGPWELWTPRVPIVLPCLIDWDESGGRTRFSYQYEVFFNTPVYRRTAARLTGNHGTPTGMRSVRDYEYANSYMKLAFG